MSKSNDNYLVMNFISNRSLLDDASLWIKFFSSLELCFEEKLTYLDINDPIRNKVSHIKQAAAYVCDIEDKENYLSVRMRSIDKS